MNRIFKNSPASIGTAVKRTETERDKERERERVGFFKMHH